MVDYNEPMTWTPPSWHRDFGDVQVEFDHLRTLAQCLVEKLPQFLVGLSVPEDGLMFLIVKNQKQKILAEVYSIEAKEDNCQRKYGVFLWPNSNAEEEQYTPHTETVVELVKSAMGD
jgi:hypothetical protein